MLNQEQWEALHEVNSALMKASKAGLLGVLACEYSPDGSDSIINDFANILLAAAKDYTNGNNK